MVELSELKLGAPIDKSCPEFENRFVMHAVISLTRIVRRLGIVSSC